MEEVTAGALLAAAVVAAVAAANVGSAQCAHQHRWWAAAAARTTALGNGVGGAGKIRAVPTHVKLRVVAARRRHAEPVWPRLRHGDADLWHGHWDVQLHLGTIVGVRVVGV